MCRTRIAIAFLLAAYASTAAASYAQMKLPGLAGMLLYGLFGIYVLVVDLVLLCKGFRWKTSVAIATVVTLALLALTLATRADVAEMFDGLTYDWEVRLLGIATVLVPAIVLVAPFVQYLEVHRRPTRRVAYAAIAVQVVMAAAWWTLDYFDDNPTASTIAERESLRARGEQAAPGSIATLSDDFEKHHAWGSWASHSLLKGLDGSALIHGEKALGADDRRALTQMVERDRAAARSRVAVMHWYGYIDAKLFWDSLEPGHVERSLPRQGTLSKYMMEFIERYGPARLCSDNRLADADRAALMRTVAFFGDSEPTANMKRMLQGVDDACAASRPN